MPARLLPTGVEFFISSRAGGRTAESLRYFARANCKTVRFPPRAESSLGLPPSPPSAPTAFSSRPLIQPRDSIDRDRSVCTHPCARHINAACLF
jgi:hypothetical protein